MKVKTFDNHSNEKLLEELFHTDLHSENKSSLEQKLSKFLQILDNTEKELRAIQSAAKAVLKEEGFEKTARILFDRCKDLIGATSGYVALLNDTGEENEVLFLESGGLPCSVDPALPMPIRGLRAEAYATNTAVYHNDFMKSDWVKFMPEGHVYLKNVMFAPLVLNDKTVGIIGLANKQTEFNSNDAKIAGLFGELAAIALRNNKNLEQSRKLESERHAEHKQLLSIFDGMEEPIYVSDPKTHELLYTNDAFSKSWGNHKNRKCYELLQGRSEPCPYCTNNQIFGDNFGSTHEWEHQNEVNKLWYRCIDRAITWPDGRIVRSEIAINIDAQKTAEKNLIHYKESLEELVEARTSELQQTNEILKKEIIARKEAERLLAKSQERLINAIETTDDGFALYDGQDRLVLCNTKYKQIYHKSADIIKAGATFEEIIRTGAERGEYSDAIGRVDEWVHERLSAHRKADRVLEQQLSDGSWIKINEKKLENGDTVAFRVDITDYKKTEAALKKNQDELEKQVDKEVNKRLSLENETREIEMQLQQAQKMEAIGTLAGGIAHDFNNILSSILGFTELSLNDSQKGSLLEDNLLEVRQAGLRAKDLVGQILTFARQSGKERSPINVGTIVLEVLRFLRSSIPTSIEIISHINSDSLILGNDTEIHQILMNLCTNAAFAMDRDGGILEVQLKDIELDIHTAAAISLQPGKFIKLSVSDTGPGINTEIIDLVFNPYFTTKKRGEGTGLGLSVVHGIVERYNGKIKVESIENKGTIFTLFFPIIKERGVSSYSRPAEDWPSGKEKILLVDDEPAVCKAAKRILESLGYSVTACSKVDQALHLFTQQPDAFDLVISDMTMPIMTGDKFAQKIITIRPEIPIIICTGFSNTISLGNYAEMGIKDLIFKPFSKTEFAHAVRKTLDDVHKK